MLSGSSEGEVYGESPQGFRITKSPGIESAVWEGGPHVADLDTYFRDLG